jgi:hypothetical protein
MADISTTSIVRRNMMANYRFGLKEMRDKNLPGNPRVNIIIKASHSDTSGSVGITPSCVTQTELVYQIDKLKAELDTLKKQGERFFNS